MRLLELYWRGAEAVDGFYLLGTTLFVVFIVIMILYYSFSPRHRSRILLVLHLEGCACSKQITPPYSMMVGNTVHLHLLNSFSF